MHDPELTPEGEEQIRALLAGARHTEPIPAEVAARMDEVLAGLAEEAQPATETATEPAAVPAATSVTPLAGRRRRRTGVLLAAACAVVVAGVAVRGWEGSGGGGGSSADSSVVSAERNGDAAGGARANEEDQPKAAPRASSGDKLQGDRPAKDRSPEALVDSVGSAPQVHLRTFARDAQALAPVSASAAKPYAAKSVCPGSDSWGNGDRVTVAYRGATAVLVYRPALEGTQRVDLFVCGESEPVRSATIHAP